MQRIFKLVERFLVMAFMCMIVPKAINAETVEDMQVKHIRVIRKSPKSMKIIWKPIVETNIKVKRYVLKKMRLDSGHEAQWEVVASKTPDDVNRAGKFSDIDLLETSKPQQFYYKVDVEYDKNGRMGVVYGEKKIASNVIICIDPGHYAGKNEVVGEKSYGYVEGEFTLKIGLSLKEILKKEYGIDSYLTRKTGTIMLGGYKNLDLDSAHISLRGEYAAKHESNLFVSLHTNANNENVNGCATNLQPKSIMKTIILANSIACKDPAILKIANSIGHKLSEVNYQKGISANSKFRNAQKTMIEEWTDTYNDSLHASGTVCKRTGSKGGDYYGVLRGAANVAVPGIIIEHGHHTVASMRKLAKNTKLYWSWAKADASGIADGLEFKKME